MKQIALALSIILGISIESYAATATASLGVSTTVNPRNENKLELMEFDEVIAKNSGDYVNFAKLCIDNNNPNGYQIKLDAKNRLFWNNKGSSEKEGYAIEYLLKLDIANASNTMGAKTLDNTSDINLSKGSHTMDFNQDIRSATNNGIDPMADGSCGNGLTVPLQIKFAKADVAKLLAANLAFDEVLHYELNDL